MESKKPTKGELERRIKNAVVFIPKDKDTQTIFFDDKGLRLTTTKDFAIIETGYHRHVFDAYSMQGISRPYLYTNRIIEVANDNDCIIEDERGNKMRSFQKLISVLKEKESKAEYYIATYFDWYVYNITMPLYGIAEDEASSFLVYEDYIHNIARNGVILSEKTEDMTNRTFIDKVCENIKEMASDLQETVLFRKKTDDEVARENFNADIEQQNEDAVEAQIDVSQD